MIPVRIPPQIFKAYDIRGIVGRTLDADIVEAIGHAIGSEAINRGQRTIAIGRDGRLSGPELIAALARGLLKADVDVIDLGCVTTPMAYFAAFYLDTHAAVMLTGSHNPPDYNGLKIVLGGEALSGAAIQALRERIEQGDLCFGSGSYRRQDISAAYIARITTDIKLARPMKIAIDCGNGVSGLYVIDLFEKLGCIVEGLHCKVDGSFPNHHPDPSDPANLEDLIASLKVGQSEIGLAFDGDGDRLGVVTKDGNIVCPDRQLMLFSADLLARSPGAEIIYDVKCSRLLFGWIRQHGGKPLMWKAGHSLIKAKMCETGALLAAEMTGHLFFKERWYGFDDGLYAAARLLEILSRYADPGAVLNALPDSISTPELHIHTEEGEHHALISTIKATAHFSGALEIIDLDGLRVEYADGFGLARASNTIPAITLRFEADTQVALERIQDDFRRIFNEAAPHLQLPF
jgi:phosphomannomutase/phosphoglucomutase